jgi:hypothetical protein
MFQLSLTSMLIKGMSEYDENCGRAVVVDPTNVVMPIQNLGQQDYIVIPGTAFGDGSIPLGDARTYI